MEKILYSFTWTEGKPQLSDLKSKLGIAEEAIDKAFGIVEIDPADHLYCILVDVNALPEKSKKECLKGSPLVIPKYHLLDCRRSESIFAKSH